MKSAKKSNKSEKITFRTTDKVNKQIEKLVEQLTFLNHRKYTKSEIIEKALVDYFRKFKD